MNDKLMEALKQTLVPMGTVEPFFKGMIYGESGVGKTVAAVQLANAICPVGKRILYIDAVEGWVSLLNHPELKSRVDRMTYQGLSQLDVLGTALKGDFKDTYGVIIIDELSTISTRDLDTVLKANAKKDPSKDPDVSSWPDMNATTQRMRRAVMELLKSEIHQIYLSHERNDEDEKKRKTTRPDFMPKISKTIREQLHLVARMTASEKKDADGNIAYQRAIQTHPTTTIVAKSRIGGLGVHCSVGKLIQVVEQWLQGNVETMEAEQEVINDLASPESDSEDPAIIVE